VGINVLTGSIMFMSVWGIGKTRPVHLATWVICIQLVHLIVAVEVRL